MVEVESGNERRNRENQIKTAITQILDSNWNNTLNEIIAYAKKMKQDDIKKKIL